MKSFDEMAIQPELLIGASNRAREIVEELEEQTHFFVIKFWLEEVQKEIGRVVWRGHITHVSGAEQSYLKDLDSIKAFIAPFLEGEENLRRF